MRSGSTGTDQRVLGVLAKPSECVHDLALLSLVHQVAREQVESLKAGGEPFAGGEREGPNLPIDDLKMTGGVRGGGSEHTGGSEVEQHTKGHRIRLASVLVQASDRLGHPPQIGYAPHLGLELRLAKAAGIASEHTMVGQLHTTKGHLGGAYVLMCASPCANVDLS